MMLSIIAMRRSELPARGRPRMVTPADPSALDAFPPELIARVVDQANRDAELAISVLDRLGVVPPPGQVRYLPAEFLLELGAACQLIAWEAVGLTLHREAGLP